MTLTLARKSSLLVLLLLPAFAVYAQQRVSNDARIQSLEVGIKKELENSPSKESPDYQFYKKTLSRLRQQLLWLLVKRTGALETRIQNLSGSDLPDISAHVRELGVELANVNGEIARLRRALGSDIGTPSAEEEAGPATTPGPVAVTLVPPPPTVATPVAPPAPAQSPTPDIKEVAKTVAALKTTVNKITEENLNKVSAVIAAVNKISDDDLKKAAAPKEVTENKLPAFPCSDQGQAVPTSTNVNPSLYDVSVCALARDINLDDRIEPGKEARLIYLKQDSQNLFRLLIAKLLKTTGTESYVALVTEAQERRIDQQIGAGASSSGTTSLVSKGGIPYLFGLAVENGAATQSQSDTTITFRVNPAGALNLIQKKGFISGFRQNESDPFLKFLSKSSLGFSFDTNRGAQPGVFTGDKQQLSAFSAKFEFVNDRDPRLKRYERDWEEFAAKQGILFAQQMWKTTISVFSFKVPAGEDAVFADPALQAWLVQTNNRIGKVQSDLATPDRINAIAIIVRDQLDLVPVKLVSEQTVAAITDFAKQLTEYLTKKNQIFDKIARGKILSFEYTNNRAVNAPDTSNFNFIAATGTSARIDLTANGSFTFFNKLPVASVTTPHPGRVRDFQFAGQLTAPFKVGDGQFDFWFSGRYERLLSDASTIAGTTMPKTKGDIAVGQFGLNIPIKSLGIKFPISVTFANRTELIKEKEIRGNIGFTMNWDTLFSKLKPF